MSEDQLIEWLACAESAPYFVGRYGQIYDATLRTWLPFDLWPAQRRTLRTIERERLTIVLKARQLGLTWLCLGFALWLLIFHPAAAVLLFSRRDDEAIYMLGDERLKGMYARLPDWMRALAPVSTSNDHEWSLATGSVARAFPTSAGDSYTASLAIVDEADLVPDLGRLMRAVKPTIDGGGRMVLLSRSDKSNPNSEFKRIYRAAKAGESPWAAVFLPWHVRPERSPDWYAEQTRDVLSRTGALDDLHEQYPATDAEALAPRSLDKRLPAAWLDQCYQALQPIAPPDAPAIAGLVVYRAPQIGRQYVIGADPAEGNPTSDDSALAVVDADSGEEVAALVGKLQPSTLAAHAATLSSYYNGAEVLVERNNHGHAVLLWLSDNAPLVHLVEGSDGKPGWLSNSRGKTLLYDSAADVLRDGDAVIHSFETYLQLASIEGSTLRAPDGEHDDRADSYALAQLARGRMGGPVAAPVVGGSRPLIAAAKRGFR